MHRPIVALTKKRLKMGKPLKTTKDTKKRTNSKQTNEKTKNKETN